jgi:hypothetical protein
MIKINSHKCLSLFILIKLTKIINNKIIKIIKIINHLLYSLIKLHLNKIMQVYYPIYIVLDYIFLFLFLFLFSAGLRTQDRDR